MSLMPLGNPHIKQPLRPVLRKRSEVHEPEAREGAVVGARGCVRRWTCRASLGGSVNV
jgi:hypothetical protein